MASMIWMAAGAGVVLLAWLGWRLWRGSRRGEMARLARSLGIEHAEEGRVEATGWLDGLDDSWPRGSIRNVWAGEVADAQLLLFERHPPGRAADPMALFGVASEELPAFDLAPRSAPLPPQTAALTVPDSERFAEIYRLACADAAILETLFRPEVRRFFERAENLDWRVRCDGSWLGITTWPLGERTRSLSAKHLASFVEDAKLVFRVLRGEPPRPRIGDRAG